MGSEEDSLPRPCVPRQPRLLPRAGRAPPNWARGRSPLRGGGRGHRRIPIPVPRRTGPRMGVGRPPEGFLGVQEGGATGYQNGGGPEWNRSFGGDGGQPSSPPPQEGQRRAEGPVRGHSVPDPYHGASRREDEDGWQDVLPPVSSSYSLPELPHLSEGERQSIMEVIRRDEHLRRQDELRVMRLKAELQFLRRKGALRADWDPGAQTGASPGIGGGGGIVGVGGIGIGGIGGGGGNGGARACARCRAELGRIINRGAFCRACRLRVCKACREYNVRATDWVCSVCHKHMEIQVATGEWMNEFVRRPSRRRDNRVYVPAADIVKRSIRRSWTISTSHRRSFGGPHGSPELRAYSSLPRGVSYLPAAAAEAAADAADAAADARRSTENRESTPHRRLPANPLLSLLRRGSSSGGSEDIVPTRKATSLEEDSTSGPLPRDDSVFVESTASSPGKKTLGRKAVSLRRQQAVWTGSTGSTGPESSGGESPGIVPKSPRDKEAGKAAKDEERPKAVDGVVGEGVKESAGGEGEDEDEEEEEEPVEDFDVEPISGTIFRKVTIRKKKKKEVAKVEEEVAGECEDSGVGGDAGTTTPSSASPTVAPSPSLVRYEKLQQPAELSRRLGAQESTEGGGSPAAAALLLDYVLDEGKIQPDGEDYKLVFISSDSSSKASTTNSDEEAPADEDCDWDYFEPARAVVVREIGGGVGGEEEGGGTEGVVGVPPPSLSPSSAPGLPPSSPPPQLRPTPTSSSPPSPEVSKLLPATQSGAAKAVAPPTLPQQHRRHHHLLPKGAVSAAGELLPRGEEETEEGEGVVALTDHIFFVEPIPAPEVGMEAQAGVEGGMAVSRRARRRRARRVGRSRSETDLARLHLRLAPTPDDVRSPGERSGSGGFVIDEGPTILAAGEFGPAGTVEGTGIRMWTVARDTEEYGPAGKRTIIPVPVPVPVPAWPVHFEKGEEAEGTGAHTLPRGTMGDAVSVADIVYLGPAGSNAVRIRIRSFQRSSSASHESSPAVSQPHSSVSHVSVVGSSSPAPSSWYAWHRVFDSPSSSSPSSPNHQHAFTSSVTLSSSLQDCYAGGEGVGDTATGGLKEIVGINPQPSPETLLYHSIEEEKQSEFADATVSSGGEDAGEREEVVMGVVTVQRPEVREGDIESGAEGGEGMERGEGELEGAVKEEEVPEKDKEPPSSDSNNATILPAGVGLIEPEPVDTEPKECFETNALESKDCRESVGVYSPGAKGELLLSAESSKCESVTEIVSSVVMEGGEREEGGVGEVEREGGEAEEGGEGVGECKEETTACAESGEAEETVRTEETAEEDKAKRDEDVATKDSEVASSDEGEMAETRAPVPSAENDRPDEVEVKPAGDKEECYEENESADEPTDEHERAGDGGVKSDCDKEERVETESDVDRKGDKGDETEGVRGDKEELDVEEEKGEEILPQKEDGEEREKGEERVEGGKESNADEPPGEVVEKEECRRSDVRVGKKEEESAADSEETRNAITEEEVEREKEGEVEITAGEWGYKGSEAIEGGEAVLIEAPTGDVGESSEGEGNNLEGDKTETSICCVEARDKRVAAAEETLSVTCDSTTDYTDEGSDARVVVRGGVTGEEGNGAENQEYADSEEVCGTEVKSEGARNEERETENGETRKEEVGMEEREDETDGEVVLLSYRPLFDSDETKDEKVSDEGAWADDGSGVCSRPQPSHTPGVREISRGKVGALSTVGGVAAEEKWEGKEVGLPRPPTSTTAVEAAEDGSREGGEGCVEGETAESSGTSSSVVQEIRRGVDEPGERQTETEGPSPRKGEEECQIGAGGGRVRRGKRRRNRRRRRRRGKQRVGEKAVVVPVPKECVEPAMDDNASDDESVAAPDSDEYETSSGEFDLASGPRWASIMTPPSVSSNSDAAGNSEESDSDDENFSRVFVVNPADDEEDEGVGRERGEEEDDEEEEGRGGEVIAEVGVVKEVMVRLEGAVLPYGGAGVRLMHIRALTDDDHVAAPRSKDIVAVVGVEGDAVIAVQDGRRASSSPSGDIPSESDSVGSSHEDDLLDKPVLEEVREIPSQSTECVENSSGEGVEVTNPNTTNSSERGEISPPCERDDLHEIDKPDGADSEPTGREGESDKAEEEVQPAVFGGSCVEGKESGEEGKGWRDSEASEDKESAPGDQIVGNVCDAKCREGRSDEGVVVLNTEIDEPREDQDRTQTEEERESAVVMTTADDAAPQAAGGGGGGGESLDSGSGESEPRGGEKAEDGEGGGVEDGGGRLADPPSDGEEDKASGRKCIGDADSSGCDVAGDGVVVVVGGSVGCETGLIVDVEGDGEGIPDKVIVSGGDDGECEEGEPEEVEGKIRVRDLSDNISSGSSCEEVRNTEGVNKGVDCEDVSPTSLENEVGGDSAGREGGDVVFSEGNMLQDPLPLSGDPTCGGVVSGVEEGEEKGKKPPQPGGELVVSVAEAEGERTPIAASETGGTEGEGRQEEDRISSQFHAKATDEQVSLPHAGKGEQSGGDGETHSPTSEEVEDITTPALKTEIGAPLEVEGGDSGDGSEMAPASDRVVGCGSSEEEGSGGEGPEVTVGEEETDPVPAGEPADPAAAATPASIASSSSPPPPPPSSPSPPPRRLSLPSTLSPPGENGREEGRASVDAWKAPREDDECFTGGGGSFLWRSVGGGGRAGEGRCVSLEDILNPEGNARPFAGAGCDSTVTTGGGGGVYTSYVMITQDGGGAGEGLRRECGALSREEEEVEEVAEEGVVVVGERSNGDDATSGRHQRVNVSVVTSETTTLVSEEEEEQEEMEEDGEGEVSSDEGGVVLRHVNWEEEEGKGNMGLAGYFTLTLETGTASPTPPRRPEIKSRKTIQLKDPSGAGDGVVDLPICGGELSAGETSTESDEGRSGEEDAVKVVTGGDTLSAVVCLEEGLADDDSWVEEVDATADDIRDDEDDELGSESASSGDEAYFDREEELRGYNRAIDFTLHTILEESGEESEAENHLSCSQGNGGHQTQGSKHRTSASNAEADASELEKYYFFGLGCIGGNAQEDCNDDLKYANEESEISDTVSETSCSSIYSEGLESLGIAGAPGHDGITESAESIMGMDPADLASSRLEKYFLTGFLGLEPPRGLRAPLGDEDGFSENTDESGSVGSDSEGRPSPEQRRKRLVRARGAGRQHHNSGGSGGGAASDAEAATGSPSGGESSSYPPQVTHTHSQVHHQQQQKLLGQQQQMQQQSQNSGQEPAEGEDSSTESDSFDETAFEKGDGQFDTVKRKKKKRKESRHQEGDAKEDGIAVSGEELDGAKTPQPDLETVAEEEEEIVEVVGEGERRERADEVAAALEAENGMGPGGQGGRKQASRDSGFIGSCDDLLKDQQQQRISDGEQRSSGSDRDIKKAILRDDNEEQAVKEDALKTSGEGETQVPYGGDSKPALGVIGETEVAPLPLLRPVPSGSPASISRTSLSRKDSFNNWSSDEETNLMMSKMRAFFKTMVAGKMASAQSSGLKRSNSGRQSSGGEAHSASSSTNGDIPEPAEKVKPPQLVYFENELTRLMKTVPGIRDEQVREIVEYLSSEDTWSDSYDSSDYTSSDLEGAGMGYHKRGPSGPLRTELQQQISASCQQIIRNFDNCTDEVEEDENFGRPKSATGPTSDAMIRESAFVYQRLVASFGKVAGGVGEPSSSDASSTPHSSPPLIAKVMHHIGGRLVALMHEVSAAGSGDNGPLPSSSTPNGSPFTRNLNAAGSPKTGNNQVAAAMAARYRRLLRREAAAAAKDDKGSVTSTSVESECPSTDTEERSVDSDADSSSSSPPPMSRLPSLPRSKSHDLGQWQRLLLTGEENRRVSAAHSYYYGVSGVGSSAVGGGVVGPGTMMTSSGVHPGGVGGRDNKESLRSSSSGVSDLAEEREEYERLSWRGSFESALAADSKTKLSLEAKRRSAGSGSGSASDLCSSSDQLDHRGRVRSCGSITSAGSRGSLLQQQQLGARARLSASGGDLLAYRSSASRGTVAEEHEGEGDDEGDGDVVGSTGALSRRRRSVPDARGPPGERSTTLPRSNTAVSASTNSLPRLPTVSAPPHGTAAAAIHKSQSLMGHHLQQAHQQQQQQQPHHHHHHLFLQNVKSARYRPPGFRPPPVPPVPPKRAVSVPGLNHQNRGRGERRRQSSGDDAISISETMGKGSSHAVGSTTPTAGSAPPTPGGGKKVSTGSSIGSWTNSPPTSPAVIAGGHNASEDDPTNERIPNTHHQTSTLSSLGLRSDSMASVYSGAGEGRYGTVAVRGEVEFALQYNYKQGALEILVKQCRELAPVDTKRNRSDPYVKVYLLPDKSKSGKRKTKVKKHTLNPVFDETLKFHITLNGLETRTLWLTVWHSDMFGRNDFLGEVMMSLENKVFDDPSPKWYPLQERTEPFDDLLCYKGEMIVGLKFVPPDVTNLHKKGRMSRGSLHVLVKDAKNLTAVKTNGTSDPFCKSYLLPDKGRSSKQKTVVCRRTINPVWNHTFVYEDVSLQELSERSLELTVWDHDRLASNEFLGGLRFNLGTGKHFGKNVDWMDATGREMTLWQSMLERANFWVEGCLTLRPTLDHRSSPPSTLAS